MVVDHVLTYFRSHNPAISLTPVLEGTISEAEAAAGEGVQEAAPNVGGVLKPGGGVHPPNPSL
jgi:hypothetical protein